MSATDAKLIDQFLEAIQLDITRRHESAGQRVTGRTINSLRRVVRDTEGILYAAKYFGVLEDGRGPTKSGTSNGKTVRQNIMEWLQARGIQAKPYVRKDGSVQSQEKANESLAYIIARKIHKEGNALYRRGGKSGVISGAITRERVVAFVSAFGTAKRSEFMSQIKSVL